MVVEPDETDELLPGELLVDDALTVAINSLIAIVFERLPDPSSAEHKAVMVAVLNIHRQLRERGRVLRPQLRGRMERAA
jgi:hypothetical protein